jgi:serine protease inhibitor ecotin
MNIARILALTAALSLASAATAQVTQTQPPASAPTPAATGGMDKKAISQQCSAQADQQNLHGKARKTFRARCKKMGGKAA